MEVERVRRARLPAAGEGPRRQLREPPRSDVPRRDEIEGIVAEAGYSSARALQAAMLASRRAKDRDTDPVQLLDRWRAEADALGFDADAIARCLGRGGTADLDREALLDTLASPEGLTKHAASFTRGEVVEATRRLFRTRGRILAEDGSLLATAEARYVAASESRKAELRAAYRFHMVPVDEIVPGGELTRVDEAEPVDAIADEPVVGVAR